MKEGAEQGDEKANEEINKMMEIICLHNSLKKNQTILKLCGKPANPSKSKTIQTNLSSF